MFAKSVAVFALLFAAGASALQLDTPAELTTCTDVDFTYSAGQPKYLLALVHGDNPCGDAIVEFTETSDVKQTWHVNVPAGTQVQPVIIDSTGQEVWGGIVTVKAGPTDCLTKVDSAPAPAPPKSSSTSSSTTPKPTNTNKPASPPAPPAGIANVEAGSTAASSFVISSGAVAGVIAVAALLL